METQAPILSDEMLNAEDVAKMLKVSLPTVYAWREKPEVESGVFV